MFFWANLDFDGGALLLHFVQGAALLAQPAVGGRDLFLLGLLERQPFGDLHVDLFALVLEALDFLARLGDFRFSLELALQERLNFGAALPGQMGQFGDALFQRLFLAGEGSAQLVLGGERDFGFGQARRWPHRAAGARFPAMPSIAVTRPAIRARAFPVRRPARPAPGVCARLPPPARRGC